MTEFLSTPVYTLRNTLELGLGGNVAYIWHGLLLVGHAFLIESERVSPVETNRSLVSKYHATLPCLLV